jgi:hypothetical protein
MTDILRTLIDCTFFDRRQTSVAGINLQGYNGFLNNMKQLRWRVFSIFYCVMFWN